MNKNNNKYHQTREWEEACIKTRRNLRRRKNRLSYFSINRKDKVLDLGCGDGLNVAIFRETGVKNVVGVDISNDLIKNAQKNNPKNKFYVGSSEKLPFTANAFDIVFVDSVFHHLVNYDKSIREIKRVLKRGGELCFIEPHRSIFRNMLDFVSILPISAYLPFLKERSKAYMGEIEFMKHWLATEDEFYNCLTRNNFSKVFCHTSLLSKIAKYKKK